MNACVGRSCSVCCFPCAGMLGLPCRPCVCGCVVLHLLCRHFLAGYALVLLVRSSGPWVAFACAHVGSGFCRRAGQTLHAHSVALSVSVLCVLAAAPRPHEMAARCHTTTSRVVHSALQHLAFFAGFFTGPSHRCLWCCLLLGFWFFGLDGLPPLAVLKNPPQRTV